MNAARMRALLLVLLAAGSIAAPFAGVQIQADSECRSKTRFQPGKEFTYSYVGETVSGINGSSEARSALKIAARCIIQTVDNCRHRLKIDQAELWEAQSKTLLPGEYHLSKGTAKFARELEAHDLYFRTERGAIKDVTPSTSESAHVFNIKKGILSALQVQMIEKNAVVEETDIAGKCKVNYNVHKRFLNARPKIVSKSRNLTDCMERSKTDLGIHIHQYNEQAINLLSSTSNCRYYLNMKRRVQKVVCEEKHIFRPFSAGYKSDAGAITTTKQVLKLTSVSRTASTPFAIDAFMSRPLTFEHVKSRSDSKDIYTAEDLITRLVRQSLEETKPDSARLFSRLVFALRKLQPKAMEFFWERIFDCDKSGVCQPSEKDRFQTYLLDALPHCGTSGCAKVMSHAIKNELISGERGNMFLTGLALVSRPTEGMIEHLLDLCQARSSRSAMLTLGTMIHKYCEENKCDELDYQSSVVLAEQWLQGLLGKRCDFSNPEQAEEILIALKAIGNAGRPSAAQNTILHCAVNDNLPINMTIAALESLRRMPCRQETTEQLMNIYGSHYYDVEIRIASYLALLKCPSVALFQRITKIQRTEVNNQVGSFVWSHISNAMESTEPRNGLPVSKMIHKALDGKVLREFNLNRLRFSRAVEGSFYSDILRAGGSVQGHLIYHPNSFFPRSAHLNLTMDILGASINLFDAAARFEGFEILLEQFFGADGYFPDDRVMAMFNLKPHEARDKEERNVNGLPVVRGRRSLTDDMNRVESHLNNLNRKMDTRKHAPSGSMSVKVFGNEMRLASFDDINWLQSEADNINMVDFLMTLAKGGRKTYTKSMVFLDAETTVPTSLGLPLKLDVKGTSVVSVEMNGKFDIRNMFWGPMAFDVRGHLKPSAVVEIAGRMGVNALFAEAGILVNSSVYTSTEIKGNGTYKQGQVLKFELGAPTKPFQVFNVSSSLFTTLNDQEVKIDGAKRRVEPAPCLNATRVLGLAVCGRLSVPLAFREYESPFFPLSGSASFSLSVIPTDPKLRVYQLIAERRPTEDENKYDIIAKMSTPNATWEREFEANASLWLQEEEKSFSISTGALGYKFGKLEGSYNNNTHAVNMTFSANDVVYGNRIVLNAAYFNSTDSVSKNRRMGTTWSATYKNYTVRQLTELYNKSGIYGFTSNTTYWPGKYIYANGEVNVPKKSFEIIANHTCTKTFVCLNGSLGEDEHKIYFNFTNKPTNFSIQTTGSYNKADKEAIVNTFVKPHEQSFTVHSSFANKGVEKGIHFRASHDNKNRVFAWYAGIVNGTQEKSVKANSTIMGKPMEAVWTFFNYTSEKGIKFAGSAVGKSVKTAFTFLKTDNEKTLKFNASGFNKNAEAMWSYLNLGMEKSLKFNASALNKKVSAVWSYLSMKNEKSVKFNGTGFNKTVTAVWSFLNHTNEKSLKFNGAYMNKTISAAWSYLNFEKEKTLMFNAAALNKTMEAFLSFSKVNTASKLSFNASVMNKTIQSALTFFNLTNEKIVKMNATVLNRTVEAMWTVFNYASEKGLRFDAKGMNKSASFVMNYITRSADKALKINATVMNKTVEAMWSYLNRGEQRFAKFNVSAMNKTIEAVWTYFSFASERGLKFNVAGLNKSAEVLMAYFDTASEKGVKFNATLLQKSINATLAYFKYIDNMGVRFNASGFNKTIELMSKMFMKDQEKKLVLSGSFQNYTVSLVGLLQNLTMRKSLCLHPEVLGRSYGEVCATFSKSAAEQFVSFNISALNRTAEIKSQSYEKPSFCARRFTASYNKKTYLESWLSVVHTDNQKVLQMNTTVAERSVDAKFFFEKAVGEKIVGFNFTILKKTMGMKSHLINQEKYKEASIHVMWNNNYIAKSALKFHNLTTEKIIKFRNQIGEFVSEVKGEYILQKEGTKKTFVLMRMLRNGSKSLFYDRSELSYLGKSGKRQEIETSYTLRILGRTFSYGLELSHHNSSDDILTHHQFKTAVIYSRGKRMSLTSIFRHDKNEMSKNIIVEYLPGKKMQHSIVWYKQRNFVATTWELLPRIPVRHTVEWNKRDGLFIRHTASAFGKRISSYLRFSESSESYDGKLEVWPRKTVTFRGQFSRAKGLFLTSEITAFQKTWSQKIDFNKVNRYFQISLEAIPKAPAVFEARWDTTDGLKISTELNAFKKSLRWDGIYEKLTKTWTSDLTIMKEKLTFVESFDINTNTLAMSVKARGRAIGFIGRFDWKAYVASGYLTCNEHKTGWFLQIDTKARNIIYNVTLNSRISGQIAAEMPNDNQMQVTFQRKFGVNVVNESRLVYQLSPKASRVFLTWNTTTVTYLVGQVKSLKPMIMNATTKMYNMTLLRAKNITKEVEKMVKKFENKIKPAVMKYYKQIQAYDFKGLYKNASNIAQNMSLKTFNLTMKAYNLSIQALNTTINNLPMLVRNATILYKKIRAELKTNIPLIYGNASLYLKNIKMHLKYMSQNVSLHLKNISLHLTNISRDLKSWGNNLTQMVGEIKIRDMKVKDIAQRVVTKVTYISKELSKNITVQLNKLHQKVRDIKVCKEKLGPLLDKYMVKVRAFTCNFNATCTLKNISAIAMNITLKVKNMTVLNKTIQQHFLFLQEKASNLSKNLTVLRKKIEVITRKMIKLAPLFMKNSTMKTIELARNLSKDIQAMTKEITKKIQMMSSNALVHMEKYSKPLTKLIVKVSVSIYNRAKPVVLSYVEGTKPMIKNLMNMKTSLLMFNKPMVTPFGPLVTDLMYQLLNITIHKMPVGVLLDRVIKVTIEEGTQMFKTLNHTFATNITTVIRFINDMSKKTPEQIVDITILKITELVNETKVFMNHSIHHTYNTTKQAFKAYKESIKAINRTIFQIINMKPEDVVQLSITKVHIFAKNMTLLIKNITAEIRNITKQLKNLDFVSPAQKAWKDMDMFNRFASLDMKAKWESIVVKAKAQIQALDVKSRALDVKSRAEKCGLKIMNELKEFSTLAYRAFNLTMRLGRMDITREQFVKEFMTLIESSKALGRKHFHIAKNTTFGLYGVHQRYWKSATIAAYSYQTATSQKTKEIYQTVQKYMTDFYKEHEVETKEAYNFYKAIALDVYDVVEKEALVLKGKMSDKMAIVKAKLIHKIEALVMKLRQYENMTYEEIALKIHKLSKDFGLAMYKTYSVKVMKFYNDTKNLTMRTYNLTKVMAVKYYNLSRAMAVKYYNLSRVNALRIVNNTKNFTLTYYKIYKNKTIVAYYMSKNMTLKAFNVTRNMTIHYIKYLNSTIRPKMVVYFGKGKALAVQYYNDGIELGKSGVQNVKIWYADNKEKTVEELYNEAYNIAKTQKDKAVKRVTAEYEKIVKKAKDQFQKLNRTVMKFTMEVVSVYNQTKNVTIVSGKEFVAIFYPYAKAAQNKTMILIFKIRNASIPLIQKARNLTIINLQKAKNITLYNLQKAKNLTLIKIQKVKNFTMALYRNITSRKDFKEFMAKYQVKESYAKVVAKIEELIVKAKEMRLKAQKFVKETKPKIEAKIKEAIKYLNVTLPAIIKQKRAEIMADPKGYAAGMYNTAEMKAREAFEKAVKKVRDAFEQAIADTAAGQIIKHEIWGEYLEEIKQHEIVEAAKDIYDFSKETADKAVAQAVAQLKEKVKELKIKLNELKAKMEVKVQELKDKAKEMKQKAKEMIQKTKASIKKRFNDFKQMKLREIVEHRYVFITIEFAKNTTEKVKNMTLQARNMTLKAIAIGKVYYKNMTIKAQKLIVKVKLFALVVKKNITLTFEKYRPMIKNYTDMAKKYIHQANTMRLKTCQTARTYIKVKIDETRVLVNKTIEKGIKMYNEKVVVVVAYYKQKVVPYYKNKMVPFYTNKVVPAFKKYKTMAIQFGKNMTTRAKKYIINSRPYKFTVKSYHLTVKVLRDATKMTIRESVLMLRNGTIIAYNYTVDLTNKAINMTKVAVKVTIQRLNATKIYIVKLVNNTVTSVKPLIPVLNSAKNEIVETVKFINKYYGIEDKVRVHMKSQYVKLQHHYVEYQKHTEKVPGMLKSSAFSALELVNKTIRYVNRTIGMLNETFSMKMMNMRKNMMSMRKNMMDMRAKWQIDLPKYIQMQDGVISLVIPHPRPINGNIKTVCLDACNKVKALTYKAMNMTRQAINMTKQYAKMYQMKAMKMSKVWKQVAMTKSLVLRMKVYNFTMKVYNKSMQYPFIKRHMNTTIHYLNVTRQFVREFNLTKIANLTKMYAPVVYNFTKEWCMVGFNATRNFTLQVTNIAWNITADILNSTSLREALAKAKNHSMGAYNETLKIYRILYKKTMIRYAELRKIAQELYMKIREHELTRKYLRHSQMYLGHSKKIFRTRARHFHHLKKYWHRRLSHKINHMSKMLSPRNWVPPFNSTAMIFGKPHVYTFDNFYYRFPGYNKPDCTYVLARDVRDDKFTLMSQEDSIILVTKDGNVKIHSSGRVESMVKIDTEGNKLHDGYNSELPVQTQNMTIAREGPFTVLRHDMGLEILCDIEHNVCTFNVDKWFHGRLTGLLGTNNNEDHDDMQMPNNKPAKNLIDFVNSWEVSKDPKCQIKKQQKPKSKCPVSKYSSRCRELFKDVHSPLAPFFNITNPRPFMEACENDYADCDTQTAKDMKHCNTTAAYIELLRMKGEWIEYLPECGRCANHEMGHQWFQRGHNLVDVVIVVPETQGMRGFAKKIPSFISELKRDLGKYSFNFGVVSFGGKGIHSQAHVVTVNGKHFGDASDIANTIEHLKFADMPDNDTDAFEGVAEAARYPFRAGSTKIILLLTTDGRIARPGAACVRRMTKKLQMQDITLNVIGKYRKYKGDVIGQDYRGKVFYRKHLRGMGTGVALPEGKYIELMKNTKGSVFGLTLFASDDRKRSGAVRMATVNVWKEQIKRDQKMCKECFCVRGLVGEGRCICKINAFHKC